MGATGEVSVAALRGLTYTILIKAAIGAAALVCIIAAGFALRSGSPYMPVISAVYAAALMVRFINIVACVMCLGGMCELSKHFLAAHRILAAVPVLECAVILLIALEKTLVTGNYGTVSAIVTIIMHASAAAGRLLAGASFLFLTKGFGELLRRDPKGRDSQTDRSEDRDTDKNEDRDYPEASSLERLGVIYLCCTGAAAFFADAIGISGGTATMIIVTVLNLAVIILDLIIYLRVSDIAFRIWRQRAFKDI